MLPFALETIPVTNASEVISISGWVLCFVAKKGTETKLKRRLHVVFPRWPLPTIYLVLLTAYVSAAMGSYSSFIWFSSESIRVSTKLAETIQKHRRRLMFNFFHADQQGTMFPCKHKSMEANHFKLVSRLVTSVEEDRLFYFSPGINGSNSDKTLKFVTSGLSSQKKVVLLKSVVASDQRLMIW
ncbi:unnamed protein product [Brassica oleracea var. botrytis]|uniref:Uncharacterized protein n=1 Tax=Brassica oleracea TaxID=3712 RepID=A0A3P6FB62_BRAOL|nr:unnamed protein product [Brassica oleracea]